MTTAVSPSMMHSISGVNTSSVVPGHWNTHVERDPTDAVFLASVQIKNAVIGSTYRLMQEATGALLAQGTISSDPETIANIPAYSPGMLMELRLRNSSGSTRYLPLKTYVAHAVSGAVFYVVQTEDTIAA